MLPLLVAVAAPQVIFAGSLGDLIKSLSGPEKLACGRSLQAETVIVGYEPGRIRVLKDELARTLLASWNDVGGVQILDRRRDQQSEIAQRSLANRMSDLDRILGSSTVEDSVDAWLRSAVGSIGRFRDDIDTRRYERIPNYRPPLNLPADLAMRASLRDIGSSALAQLPVGRTVVFSSVPTVAERPFTTAMVSIFKRMVQVEDRLQREHELEWTATQDWQHYWNDEIRAPMALPAGPKANLFVQREPDVLGAVYATYTPDGQLRSFSSSQWRLDSGQPPELPSFARYQEPYPLSEEGAAQLSWMRGDTSAGAWRSAMDNPVAHDPLGEAVRDAIKGLARGRPFIAWLGDQTLQDVAVASEKARINLQSFASELTRRFDPKIDGDWLIVSPRDPESNSLTRLDRRAFASFLSSLRAKGSTDLRSFSLLTAAQEVSPQQNSVYKLTLNAYRTKGYGATEYGLGFPLTKALGLLPPAQWEILAKGGSLRLGTLSGDAKSMVFQWTTTGPKSLSWAQSPPPGSNDVLLNGSDAAPLGLPADSFLEAEVGSADVLYEATEAGLANPRSVSLIAGDLAKALGDGSVQSASQLLGGTYALGTMKKYLFRLRLPTGQFIDGSTSDPASPAADGMTFDYAALPERIRREIEGAPRPSLLLSMLAFGNRCPGCSLHAPKGARWPVAAESQSADHLRGLHHGP